MMLALSRIHSTLCKRIQRVSGKLLRPEQCTFTSNSRSLALPNFENIFATQKVPDVFNFASDVFDYHVVQSPSRLALCMENDSYSRQWTFAQLRAESVRAAISLQRLLDSSIDNKSPKYFPNYDPLTILVLLPKVPEWWFLHLASLRLGIIFCPATIMLTPEDIAFRLKTSSAKIVITDDDNMWKIEEAQRLGSINPPIKLVIPKKRRRSEYVTSENWIQYDDLVEDISDSEVIAFRNAQTKASDISTIFFTSGTTGKPKRVAHTHSSYGIGHYSTATMMGLQAEDLYWCISDSGWAKSSYGNFYTPWIIGAGVYIHQMERFEVKKVLEVLCSRPITAFCAPPTLFRGIVQENDPELFKFKNLRFAVTGGEAVNPEIVDAWREKSGLDLNGIYGQTEMTASIGYDRLDKRRKENAIGFANYGYDFRITDDNGTELPNGTEGNLAIKIKPTPPVGLFKGYLRDDVDGLTIDENHKSFVGDFYVTGDLGTRDDDGHFYYVGRSDDVIISAGYRIGPFEVESILQQHPAVAENAVVSSPHPQRGAVVKAFIVLTKEFETHDPEILVKTLQDFCKQHTAPYKYPRRIEFLSDLPKTISGKILRRELRQREVEARANDV